MAATRFMTSTLARSPQTVAGQTDGTRYLEALDSLLSSIAETASHYLDLTTFIDAAEGAFPTVVASRLAHLGIPWIAPPGTDLPAGHDPTPELHILDSEWYFSAASVSDMIAVLASPGADFLCLGVPTLAVELCDTPTNVVLVDRSAFVNARFPRVDWRGRLIRQDIHAGVEIPSTWDRVILDPPWYPEEFEGWLTEAMRLVRPGGLVAFPLFGNLLRPTASRERARLLEIADRFGKIEVIQRFIRYDTPLFERRVMALSGLPQVGNWRQADLVVLHRSTKRTEVRRRRLARSSPEWTTFEIAGQVVKLRSEAKVVEGQSGLRPIPGVGCDLMTVSRRDWERLDIDLWTSRNRVAQISGFTRAARALSTMQSGRIETEAPDVRELGEQIYRLLEIERSVEM